MSTRKLITIVLLGGAVFGLYTAGAPATAAAPPGGAAGVKATLLAAPARLGHGLGVVGAKIVAPAVRKMVADSDDELRLLRQELKVSRAVGAVLVNAAAGAQRVATMDSSALRNLDAGRPVRAFRDAMQANALVTGVRNNLRGD